MAEKTGKIVQKTGRDNSSGMKGKPKEPKSSGMTGAAGGYKGSV